MASTSRIVVDELLNSSGKKITVSELISGLNSYTSPEVSTPINFVQNGDFYFKNTKFFAETTGAKKDIVASDFGIHNRSLKISGLFKSTGRGEFSLGTFMVNSLKKTGQYSVVLYARVSSEDSELGQLALKINGERVDTTPVITDNKKEELYYQFQGKENQIPTLELIFLQASEEVSTTESIKINVDIAYIGINLGNQKQMFLPNAKSFYDENASIDTGWKDVYISKPAVSSSTSFATFNFAPNSGMAGKIRLIGLDKADPSGSATKEVDFVGFRNSVSSPAKLEFISMKDGYNGQLTGNLELSQAQTTNGQIVISVTPPNGAMDIIVKIEGSFTLL